MSLDFVDLPVVWVPVWLAVSFAYGCALGWAQRSCPSELVNPARHARFRVVQAALTVLWLLFSLSWGPGNLLPDLWADLLGVLSLPLSVLVLLRMRKVLRKFDDLEQRSASVSTSEEISVK